MFKFKKGDMADKNVQIKQKTSTGYDNIYPITQSNNVLVSSVLQSKYSLPSSSSIDAVFQEAKGNDVGDVIHTCRNDLRSQWLEFNGQTWISGTYPALENFYTKHLEADVPVQQWESYSYLGSTNPQIAFFNNQYTFVSYDQQKIQIYHGTELSNLTLVELTMSVNIWTIEQVDAYDDHLYIFYRSGSYGDTRSVLIVNTNYQQLYTSNSCIGGGENNAYIYLMDWTKLLILNKSTMAQVSTFSYSNTRLYYSCFVFDNYFYFNAYSNSSNVCLYRVNTTSVTTVKSTSPITYWHISTDNYLIRIVEKSSSVMYSNLIIADKLTFNVQTFYTPNEDDFDSTSYYPYYINNNIIYMYNKSHSLTTFNLSTFSFGHLDCPLLQQGNSIQTMKYISGIVIPMYNTVTSQRMIYFLKQKFYLPDLSNDCFKTYIKAT